MQLRAGHYATAFIRDINWLWFQLTLHLNKTIENILVLDHGGHAVTFVPSELLEHYRIIGIEKRGLPPFPMIDVANCFAKRYLESPLIAKAIVTKLVSLLPKPSRKLHYGVAGLGSVGQAIIEQLLKRGQKLIVFDVNSELMKPFEQDSRFVGAKETRDLIATCDWIFGCSGRDISESSIEQLRIAPHDKTLMSCSSEDKEFLSLVRFIDKQKPSISDLLDTLE
jgi:hypothetical protein